MPRYVPIVGDLPLLADTFYSIELYAYHYVPEREQTFRFMLEENVFWNGTTSMWEFVRGRQQRFHVVNGSNVNTGNNVLLSQENGEGQGTLNMGD